MSSYFPTDAKLVINEVIKDPRFKKLNTAPKYGFQMLALYFSGLAAMSLATLGYLQNVVPYLVMLIFNGAAMIVMFGTVHEATHASVARVKWLNEWIGTIGAFFYFPGMSTPIYRYLHLSHHRYTGDPKRDPDVKYVNGRFISCLFHWLLQDLYWGAWVARNFSERTNEEKRYFIGGLFIYITWYSTWLLSPYASEFIFIYLIPQRIAYAVLLYFFSYVQHPPGILQADNPFQATVRLKVVKWLQPLIFFQDKHSVHHLFPKLPFYRYPRVWEFAQDILEQQQTPIRKVIEKSWSDVEINLSSTLYVTIVAVEEIADDTFSYVFRNSNGKSLPAFSAGSHIDVCIEDGLMRQYSITNAPEDKPTHYSIAVKRERNGRGGSNLLHKSFNVGHELKVSAPRNNFSLKLDSDNYHLFAGGIGITPILSMAHQLHALGKAFTLHLFSRGETFLPFASQLDELPFASQVISYFDDEMPITSRDMTTILGNASANKSLYICGPERFMDYVVGVALQQGWDMHNINLERFTAKTIDPSSNKEFELILQKAGKTITVPTNKTILNVIEEAGFSVPVSCEQGLCGSCVCKVVSGEVDHRDSILSEEEHKNNNQIAVCVSRSTSRSLTLDI